MHLPGTVRLAFPFPVFRNSLISLFPDVIVQMFEWNWDSIAAECTSFLGPAGVYIQLEQIFVS
jgi:hypothetical protein